LLPAAGKVPSTLSQLAHSVWCEHNEQANMMRQPCWGISPV